MAIATPTPVEVDSRQFHVSVTFHGENDQSYSLLVPADRTTVQIGSCYFPFLFRFLPLHLLTPYTN
jgi:hypothetical protein